ncbi:hypothetical protein FJTKL_11680 [Diaporthe vaccinii]|uniref:Uncharacterized protein n=1 Tax=Diaporthe vaccinii TaxID=105482 RepID=A0ABR4EFQ9_9PEZI
MTQGHTGCPPSQALDSGSSLDSGRCGVGVDWWNGRQIPSKRSCQQCTRSSTPCLLKPRPQPQSQLRQRL